MPEQVKGWWLERAREPSTYQGLSVLAGLLGKLLLGDAAAGVDLMNVGLSLAAVIQVGKAEAVRGRDF